MVVGTRWDRDSRAADEKAPDQFQHIFVLLGLDGLKRPVGVIPFRGTNKGWVLSIAIRLDRLWLHCFVCFESFALC